MNTNNDQTGSATISLLVLGVVVIVGGFLLVGSQSQTIESPPAAQNTDLEDTAFNNEPLPPADQGAEESEEIPEEAMIEAEAIVAVDAETEPAPVSVTPLAAGTYTDYSPNKVSAAADGPTVIFFHAAWCPTCRALENDIEANLSNIPPGVTILKADFDSETELKKKYGVVRQHTLVQIDANGNLIKTLTGPSNRLEQVVDQL